MIKKKKKKINTLYLVVILSFKLLINFGMRVSTYCFLKNVFFTKDTKLGKTLHNRQYESIKKKMKKKYSYINQKYNSQTAEIFENERKTNNDVWVIWWQGIEEETPGKIIENIDCIKKENKDCKVHVISNQNYEQYVSIPSNIKKMIEEERLSPTHISDYIRVLLLEKYGGIYIDCNFFVLNPFNVEYSYPFYTIKHGLHKDWHVCKGLWTTGFFCAERKHILFSFLKEMYEKYFLDYSFVPCFFFIDALIGIGYEDIPLIKKSIDKVPYNNKNYNFINERGNELFVKSVWESIAKDTYLFNVSHKKDFLSEIDNKKTFYGNIYQ